VTPVHTQHPAGGHHRRLLEDFFAAALAAVDPRPLVCAALNEVPEEEDYCVIAIGKASASMMLGAVDALGDRIRAGLAVGKRDDAALATVAIPGFAYLIGGHPLPDRGSIEAAMAIRDLLQKQPRDRCVLFLISGGTSSLIEMPAENISLDDMQRLNRYFLSSGLPIEKINAVRAAVSQIKGGGLRRWLRGQPCTVLLLSDVPGDRPQVIGSGPLHEALDELPTGLPDWVSEMINRCEPMALPADPIRIAHRVLAGQDQARAGVVAAAAAAGFDVQDHGRVLYGDSEAVALRLTETLQPYCLEDDVVVHVFSGESTVHLPPDAGQGGRNLHLALLVARGLESVGGWSMLLAGTDGEDGLTDAAGAIVDGGLCRQAGSEGLDLDKALTDADSYPVLEKTGALLRTGPTGTNVADIAIALTGLMTQNI
jgi:hydroxypyruvate reductase